jgi:xanthine dehydrogenase accessory factor
MRVWATIADMIARHGSCVLVSVEAVAGSAPREAGARMIVRPDGALTGTIGGGTLEWQALEAARRMLDGGVAGQVIDQALGPDLGQCCGGRVRLRLETFGQADFAMARGLAGTESRGLVTSGIPQPDGRLARSVVPADADGPGLIEHFGESPTPVLLFGAGHVGRALVQALAPLPFAVSWVDNRADAFPARVPVNVETVETQDPVARLATAPAGALVVVMTHSHPLDLELVAASLSRPDLPYVGLIGSDTKRARFVSSLRALGIKADRLVCPIGGKAVADKAPAVIAALVAVELLHGRQSASLDVSSWPGLSRPSTPDGSTSENKGWMPATGAGMTDARPKKVHP